MKKYYVLLTIMIAIILFMIFGFPQKPFESFTDKDVVIVCFGDSLTAGYGAQKGESYPDYLNDYITAKIINSGISGDTTDGGMVRFKKDVLDHNPTHVIIGLGANDYFRKISAKKTMENLDTMIGTLKNRGVKVYIAKFFPDSLLISFIQSNQKERYNEIYEALAKKHKVRIIDNIWDDVWGEDELMSDKIHPNGKGYKIMAKTYFKSIKRDLPKSIIK